MPIDWNPILRARAGEPVLRNAAATGGRSPTGREQRVAWDAGFWNVPLTGLVINTREKVAAFRALMARLRQGDEVIFRLCQLHLAMGARDPDATATIAGPHPLRATNIAIFVDGITLEPGYYFSLGGERLHLITEVVAPPGEDPLSSPWRDDGTSPWAAGQSPWAPPRPAGSWLIAVTPPLRSAVAGGAVADFKDLPLRCVPQELSDGDLQLDLGRFGTPSLTLIESI